MEVSEGYCLRCEKIATDVDMELAMTVEQFLGSTPRKVSEQALDELVEVVEAGKSQKLVEYLLVWKIIKSNLFSLNGFTVN